MKNLLRTSFFVLSGLFLLTFSFYSCKAENDDDSGTVPIVTKTPETGGIKEITYLYVSSSGNDATGKGTEELPFATLNKAVEAVRNFNNGEENFTIYISGTIKGVSEITNFAAKSLVISGKNKNDLQNGYVDVLDGNQKGCTLFIKTGVPVTVKNIKITGGTGYVSSDGRSFGGGIYVGPGIAAVNLTVEDGTFITGNSAERGGGAYFGCNVVMNGGLITENTSSVNGGGVQTSSKCTFCMNGGTISKNSTQENGGGLYAGSTFIFNGGSISENSASNGGGVYSQGTFTMHGGTISGNSATNGGGIYINKSGKLEMSGGTITENTVSETGGGIYSKGSFIMRDGIISKNTASYKGGGLMTIGEARFEMFGGKIIENKAEKGGGVCNEGGFLMENGEISNNEALKGAGINNHSYKSTSTIKGGLITKNKGAGIYNFGIQTISGGKIFENEGYGVYNNYWSDSNGEGGKVEVTGGEIYENEYGVLSGAEFTMGGGVIRNNKKAGVQSNSVTSSFFISGDAYIPLDESGNNFVVLVGSHNGFMIAKPVTICGNLTHEIVAGISEWYENSVPVLTIPEGADSSLLEENYSKFKLLGSGRTINNMGYVVVQ